MKLLTRLMFEQKNRRIALIILLVSIAVGFFWQHQQNVAQYQKFRDGYQKQFGAMVIGLFEKKIAALHKKTSDLIVQQQLAAKIASSDLAQIERLQQHLKQQLPEVESLCLLDIQIEQPQSSPCIDINYLVLDSLRRAKQQGIAPLVLVKPKQADPYLLLMRAIENEAGEPLSILTLTLSPAKGAIDLDQSLATNAYIEIQQGDKSPLTITAIGDKRWHQGEPNFRQAILQSRWQLVSWSKPVSESYGYLGVVLLLFGMTLLLWWLRELSFHKMMMHDLTSIKQQLDDLANRRLKVTYPSLFPETAALSEVINKMVTLQEKKSQSPAPNSVNSEHNGVGLTDPDLATLSTHDAEMNSLTSSLAFSSELTLSPAIFKAYDIRGIVGETLDPSIYQRLGRAIASEMLAQGQQCLVVARDGRLSSEVLTRALVTGILSTGCHVRDIGLVPTPLMLFACEYLKIHAGVMVTASHNPADYNGIKINLNNTPFSGESLKRLYQRTRQRDFAVGEGRYQSLDVIKDYIAEVKKDIQLSRNYKIVVDCGNGVAGQVVPKVLAELGCDVIELYCEVDGNFPNHHPNPSEPENLQDLVMMVQRHQADLGLAFDGDGDRLTTIDAEGQIIWSDRLLMLFAADVLSRLPGASVVYDVKSTGLLEQVITNAGGQAIMWKSGYALIRDKMQQVDAPLAGEMTGHIFFNDRWFGFDDAIYSACRLIELLSRDLDKRSSTEIFAALPQRYNTPEIVVAMTEADTRQLIDDFVVEAQFPLAKVTVIDGLRADFERGWGLVRASNTVSGLILRFEADSTEELKAIQTDFKQQLLHLRSDLKLDF